MFGWLTEPEDSGESWMPMLPSFTPATPDMGLPFAVERFMILRMSLDTMTTVDVTCPYPDCTAETTATIPDDREFKKEVQSYENGIRGDDNLTEVMCSCGHTYGVRYR